MPRQLLNGQPVSDPLFASFLRIIHHRARNSLPEKHCQLVNIFDSSAAHGLAA